MITKYFFSTWSAVAPALGNHLWQSTLFAVIAGALAFALRKNDARVRYWLWLAASAKFLIPFSLLESIGSYLESSRGSLRTTGSVFFMMEEASRPFAKPTMPVIFQATPSAVSASPRHLLPAVLAAVWLCGFLTVVFVSYARWRWISKELRQSVRLQEGREVETLRRIERMGGMRDRVDLLLSRTSLEPGIFGIVRPVLLWPEGISERLEDAHLEAVLAHELRHVRHRDNLASALHMLVEAIFWFYPPVWWIGARLVEERERACDEEVLESGSERQAYAESILKVCKFCVGSRLACVSGVTGADLKKRLVRIMTGRVTHKLDFRRKLLLVTAGLLAVAAPIVFGQARATQQTASQDQSSAGITPAPVFEVASIKPDNPAGDRMMFGTRWTPDGLTTTGSTVRSLIVMAYNIQDSQILGAPNWINSERYDIQARVDGSVVEKLQKLSPDQRALARQHILQTLLADRFKLAIHRETKELPVYALVIAKNGAKLKEAGPNENYANGMKGADGHALGRSVMRVGRGEITGQTIPMVFLVQTLSDQPELNDRVLLDRTGLTGSYDFTLQWTPENSMLSGMQKPDNPTTSDSSGPSLFTAIEEQLGLKIESTKGPVDALVIDHVEHPSEN